MHVSASGDRAFVCVRVDGSFIVVPEWMTERERCARLQLVETPQASLTALVELQTLLGSATMRWDDVPASLRTRLGEHLAVLLRQAAGRASAARQGDGDDE